MNQDRNEERNEIAKGMVQDILLDVAQVGSLDIYKLMTTLLAVSGCNKAFFFEVYSLQDFVCRFTTHPERYNLNVKYQLEDLPDNLFSIYVKDALVAALTVCETEKYAEDLLKPLHDVIAVAMHFNKTQSSNQKFIVTVTNDIFSNLRDIARLIVGNPKSGIVSDRKQVYLPEASDRERVQRAIKYIADSTELVMDVHDYALLQTHDLKLLPTRFEVRPTLYAVVSRVQAVYTNYNITLSVAERVPLVIDFEKKRLEKNIVQTVLLSLVRVKPTNVNITNDSVTQVQQDKDIVLHVDIEPRTANAGNLMLNFKTSSMLPDDIVRVVNTRYIVPDELGLCIARELCLSTGGYIRIMNDKDLRLTVGFQFTEEDNALKDQQVLVFVQDPNVRVELYRQLMALKAIPTLFTEENSFVYFSHLHDYAVAIMDDVFAPQYFNRIKDNRVPVMGLNTQVSLPFDAVLTSYRERELIDTFKKITASKV